MSKLAERVQQLRETQIFGRLSPRRLRKLARLCVDQTFQRGDLVVEQGSVGLGMYVIVSGTVEVFRGERGGGETLATLKPGDLLGEVALVDELPRSASARALERSHCLLVTRESFRQLTRKDPEIAWCIVPTLTARLRAAQRVAKAVRATQTIEFTTLQPEATGGPLPRESQVERTALRALRRPADLAAVGARCLGAAASWSEELFLGVSDDLAREADRGGGTSRGSARRGLEAASRRLVLEGLRLPSRIARSLLDVSPPSEPHPDEGTTDREL